MAHADASNSNRANKLEPETSTKRIMSDKWQTQHVDTSSQRLKRWMDRAWVASIPLSVQLGSRFLRTIILSRLLSVEEFGTALAITVVLSFAEVATDVAFDRFVMVFPDKAALAAAHVLSIARGALITICLALTAREISALFGIGKFSDSFLALAPIPFVRSFAHFGIKQVQRSGIFWPESAAQLIAHFSALAIVIPAFMALRDHRVVIVSIATEAACYVLASHAFSRERYSIWPTPMMLRAALIFGIPLALNGVGLAVLGQLDRAFVGFWFGVETLAAYSVLLNMSVIPLSLIISTGHKLGFAYLFSGSEIPATHSRQYFMIVVSFSIVGVAYSLFLALSTDVLTPLIFGARYVISLPIHTIICIIAFFRLLRGGAPTLYLLATGRTAELATLNLCAVIGLILAAIFSVLWPQLESMLLGVLVGDVLVSLLLLFCLLGKNS